MLKKSQVVQAILITLGCSAALFSGCESDDVISGTRYSGPAAVFHSEERFLEEETGSCLEAPLPWDAQLQLPDCQLEVEYYRKSNNTNYVPFPCPALANGTWSDSWQSRMQSKIANETISYDVAHCLIEPTAAPLKCNVESDSDATDSEDTSGDWHYCENDVSSDEASGEASGECLYNAVVSPSLAQEINDHPQVLNGAKLSCSKASPPPPSNGATGIAIGDACAGKTYMPEAGILLKQPAKAHDILYWLEAQAPQCSQGLCLSTVRRVPEAGHNADVVAACEADDATIEECARLGWVEETSACTCRCEDADGNRAEDDDSLCACPDDMQCQIVELKPSAFPEELRGGYCVAAW